VDGHAERKHIGKEMRIISNLVHRVINQPHGTSAEEESVSGTNCWILGYLAQNEDRDVFQRDLEETFQVRRATVSKILGLMEQKGLIERCPVPQDARLKKIRLTEKGRRFHLEKVSEFESIESQLVKDIPEEKLKIFFEVCDMIKTNAVNVSL
jgi:DNA-binding MarR family transcriptional regulator